MNTTTRRLLLVPCLLLAACAAEEAREESGASTDQISLSNLASLIRGKVDRTKVDPFNPWAQKDLAIGEENVLPGEAEEFAGYAKLVNRMQTQVKEETGSAKTLRALHAKTHACVQGELTIDSTALPKEARIGVFAESKTYPTWARFSNGVGTPNTDRKADVRGLAIKIMGVTGKRVINQPGDETATTQDFLLADQSVAPAPDARHMVQFVDALGKARDSEGILGKIEALAHVGGLLTRDENVRIVDFFVNRVVPQAKEIGSPLGDVFFTGAPNALGLEAGDPNTAKAKAAFKLRGTAGVLRGDSCVPLNEAPTGDPGYFRNALERQLERGGVCVDLAVQFQKDPKTESIEDVSVEWQTPFTTFARLTFPKIDIEAEGDSEALCDSFSFTPWHTLAVHRPLGNAMRARRVVLASSAAFRGAVAEPKAESAGK